MTNSILASSLQKGDYVQYRTGDFFNPKDRYFPVTRVKDMGNGVLRIQLDKMGNRYRLMDVRKNQEVRIQL